MEYFKLIVGIILLAGCTFLLMKGVQRKGFFNALLQIDTGIGLFAGVYLIVTGVSGLIG